MYKLIASGSAANAIIYHETILVDCGTAYAEIEPYINQIQIVLLTHKHGDHFRLSTISKILSERPSIRIGCCEWMTDLVSKFSRNIDIYEIGKVYSYGSFSVSPIKLYHDVPNCGYRIFKGEHKIIHATDTEHLDGITAKGYDLYAIEHNYDEDTVFENIARIEANGGFAHQRGSINSHLSEQQAREFISNNRNTESKILRLHESNH